MRNPRNEILRQILKMIALAGCLASLDAHAKASGDRPLAVAAPTAVAVPTAAAVPAAAAAPAATPPTGAATGAGAGAAIVEQPRPFGYVLGDTLTQRILLRVAGHNFDPAAFPPSERAGLWFARRSSRIEAADEGQRWLVIDYQLINAPQALMTVNVPAVTLKAKSGDEVLTVSEWPVSIAPLTPHTVFAKGGLQELRPDHPAPTLPTLGLRRRLEIWSSAFAATLLAWLAWWSIRSLRAAANQPFARALRELRRSTDDSAAAWMAMHRAFDRTAGRALQLSTLPVLFTHAPHFEPQRAAIERFYADSNLRFFNVTPAPATSGADSLRRLCTDLRRIEKRYER